ncbi:hypothetical protein Plhal304r1_c006g0024651 [Plasmopara halstedii]
MSQIVFVMIRGVVSRLAILSRWRITKRYQQMWSCLRCVRPIRVRRLEFVSSRLNHWTVKRILKYVKR